MKKKEEKEEKKWTTKNWQDRLNEVAYHVSSAQIVNAKIAVMNTDAVMAMIAPEKIAFMTIQVKYYTFELRPMSNICYGTVMLIAEGASTWWYDELCRYGTDCSRGDCKFQHPYGKRENVPCRYGSRCTRHECWYEH